MAFLAFGNQDSVTKTIALKRFLRSIPLHPLLDAGDAKSRSGDLGNEYQPLFWLLLSQGMESTNLKLMHRSSEAGCCGTGVLGG
jgi:hypothetical protein